MSDSLHLVYSNNTNELLNVPKIIKDVNYTIDKIPTPELIKQRKRLHLEANEESKSDEESEVIEEFKGDEAGNDQSSDVQKVLQIIRDYIIKNNVSIRQAFELPDINSDYFFELLKFKNIVKEICGRKATLEQIELTTDFVFKGTLKLEEEKKKQDNIERVQEKGYIEKPHESVINFRFFEQMLKKILRKVGYKPILKRRDKDEEQQIEYVMEKEHLGINITNDFRNYLKVYLQYQDLIDEQSDLEMLFLPYFSKILRKLKSSVSKGTIGNDTDHATVQYFKNLMSYIGENGRYLYLLKIFIFIASCFDPKNPMNQKLYMIGNQIMSDDMQRDEENTKMLQKIQSLMDQAGIIKFVIDLFTKVKNEETLNTCLTLLNILLKYSNLKIQKSILKTLKSEQRNVKLFTYIRDRLAMSYINTGSIKMENPLYLKNEYGVYDQTEKTRKEYNCYNVLDLMKLLSSN